VYLFYINSFVGTPHLGAIVKYTTNIADKQ
jgi:hypothetical protein